MAGITEALEAIQISAMDQRQNTPDIFDAKSGPGQSFVNTRRSLRFRSRTNYIPIASLADACNVTSAYCRMSKVFGVRDTFHEGSLSETLILRPEKISFGEILTPLIPRKSKGSQKIKNFN